MNVPETDSTVEVLKADSNVYKFTCIQPVRSVPPLSALSQLVNM